MMYSKRISVVKMLCSIKKARECSEDVQQQKVKRKCYAALKEYYKHRQNYKQTEPLVQTVSGTVGSAENSCVFRTL